MSMVARTKEYLRNNPAIYELWGCFRRFQHERDYLQQREIYFKLQQDAGKIYRESEVVAAARERIAKRGYEIQQKALGQIHTFVYFPRSDFITPIWRSLHGFGKTTVFDFIELGFSFDEFMHGAARRREMNDRFLKELRAAHAAHPVDWVLTYSTGVDLLADTVRSITEELGVPVVNYSTDDKNSWCGPKIGEQRTGMVDIASVFDLNWTTARMACDWYLMEGGRALYQPEAFDESLFRYMDCSRDIPISFVGTAYGIRPTIIRYVKKFDVPIQIFGRGWGDGYSYLSEEEMVTVFNRSIINLGVGGFGYSEMFTNVKARDFEVPACGGGVYLTSFNPELAEHFAIGSEILCYHSRAELIELIRYYLDRPAEAALIAKRGRERALRDHRWANRYERVLKALGILTHSKRSVHHLPESSDHKSSDRSPRALSAAESMVPS